VAEQPGAEGPVEIGDGAKQGAQQPDLDADQLGEDLRGDTDWWDWADRSRASSSAALRPPR
jgi:hypothetical protein